jgi:hypothetical protein
MKHIETDDLIDVRDVIARIEHLEALRQPGPIDLGEEDNDCAQDDLFRELADLESLMGDLKGTGGDEQWRGAWYPITMIRESYFQEYAQELAEDCGMIQKDARWPNNCIDWGAAADALKGDYTTVEYEGVTYYVR